MSNPEACEMQFVIFWDVTESSPEAFLQEVVITLPSKPDLCTSTPFVLDKAAKLTTSTDDASKMF